MKVNEVIAESTIAAEDAIFNSLSFAKRGDAGLAVYQIFHRVEGVPLAEQLPIEPDEKPAINKYKQVYVGSITVDPR